MPVANDTLVIWLKTLFADSAAEAVRYYGKTGIYPINHGMVVGRAVYDREPWVALNVLKAFVAANEIAENERREHVAYHLETGLVPTGAVLHPSL